MILLKKVNACQNNSSFEWWRWVTNRRFQFIFFLPPTPFLATLRHMEAPGQGSDPTPAADLHPGTTEMLLILLCHPGRSLFSFFFFFFFFVFVVVVVVAISWAAPRHMEVPRLGVESEL